MKQFMILILVLISASTFGSVSCPNEVNAPKYFLVEMLGVTSPVDCTQQTTAIREHNAASLERSSTVTISIASPAVITWANHGLVNGTGGDRLTFSTTGALPTGILPSPVQYLVRTIIDANTFTISQTFPIAVSTSGSQSGVQTATKLASYDSVFQLDAPPTGTSLVTIPPGLGNGLDSCGVDDAGGADNTEFPGNVSYNGFLGVAVNKNRILPARVLTSTYVKGKLPAHGTRYGLIRFLTDGVAKTKACKIFDGVNDRWFCRMCGKISN